jgi:hypothetical protein
MASSSEPSRKQGREEVPLPPSAEVKLPPPKEVKPPPPEVVLQPMAVMHAPPLNADEATWSVNLFRDAFVKLQKVTVHLGVPAPRDPLQMTVKDYAFEINILVGDLERGVLDGSGSGSGSGSDSDGGAPPAATTSA